MSKSSATASSGGIGVLGLLTCIFAVAKIMGKVDWSWWVVLSPVLVGAGLGLTVAIAALALAFWVEYRK